MTKEQDHKGNHREEAEGYPSDYLYKIIQVLRSAEERVVEGAMRRIMGKPNHASGLGKAAADLAKMYEKYGVADDWQEAQELVDGLEGWAESRGRRLSKTGGPGKAR